MTAPVLIKAGDRPALEDAPGTLSGFASPVPSVLSV